MRSGIRTEFEFTLPVGYTDANGHLHRSGVMRLAMARDEIEPLADPRVKDNEAYLGVLLLSRVVVRLGTLTRVTPDVIADLYALDFSYLQGFYASVNTTLPEVTPTPHGAHNAPARGALPSSIETRCPQCGTDLVLDLDVPEVEALAPA